MKRMNGPRFLDNKDTSIAKDFSWIKNQFFGNFTQITIINVASGPRRSEMQNHTRPLSFLLWARPALIRANVPQLIA